MSTRTCGHRSQLAALAFLLAAALAYPAGLTPSARKPVEFQADSVDLRIGTGIVVEVRFLRGSMEPLKADIPVTFDDASSFDVRVSFARVAISAATLANLINHYAFAYDGAPLKNVSVEIADGRLKLKGTMHKGVDMPFSLEGRPEPDQDGNIRLHAERLRAGHLPVKGLLHLFGEDLAKLVNTNEARGVRLEHDDVVLFPSRLTPPPHIIGRVTRVDMEGDRVVETFGAEQSVHRLEVPRRARNYMYHSGGLLRFGKLTMTDADLEIVGIARKNRFEFCLSDYNRQLVAGYSKNTPRHGLIVFMPDCSSLAHK